MCEIGELVRKEVGKSIVKQFSEEVPDYAFYLADQIESVVMEKYKRRIKRYKEIELLPKIERDKLYEEYDDKETDKFIKDVDKLFKEFSKYLADDIESYF